MKVDGKQLCLACGVNVATQMDGTVPLCSSCASQVKDTRGVKFDKTPVNKSAAQASTEHG